MSSVKISTKISISDLLSQWPQVIQVFLKRKMACIGCSVAAFETLEDAAGIYGIPLHELTDEVRKAVANEIGQTK